MNMKSSKVLSIGLLLVVGVVFLLSTMAMMPSQATATPTVTISATNTKLPTATPTFTPTATPSPIPTPAYPSVEDIQKVIEPQLKEINAKIDVLSQDTLKSHVSNVFDNLVSSGVWAIMVAVSAALGLTNIFVSAKVKKDKAQGVTSNLDGFQQSLKSGSWFIVLMIVIYFLAPILVIIGQAIIPLSQNTELISLSQKLDEINLNLDKLANQTPVDNPIAQPQSPAFVYSAPTTNPGNTEENKTIDWQPSAWISLGFIGLFLVVASFISRNQAKFYELDMSKVKWEELGKKLLPAIFLVLILYLLQDPIEAIVLPIIIPFVIFGLFDIVLLYPNSQLQAFVGKHYSKIIFLTVFGVWLRVFNVLQNYLYPYWGVTNNYLSQFAMEALHSQKNNPTYPTRAFDQFTYELPRYIPQLIWGLLPYILALLYTLIPWRKIRKIAEDKYVAKIKNLAKNKTK